MSRIWSSGFELNSLTGNVEITTTSGLTPTISTTTVRSGTYALRCNASTSTSSCIYGFLSANTAGSYFYRIYIYASSLPSVLCDIMTFDKNAVGMQAGVKLNTDGTLQMWNGTAQVGSSSSPLSTNTWYCIELQVNNSGAGGAHTLEARLNQVVFATSAVQTIGTFSRVSIGVFNIASTFTLFIDDVAINDSSGSFQNSYPGDGSIVHLKPNAAGDHNGFSVNVGGTAGVANNYTRVNEVTPDDATSYNGDAPTFSIDDHNLDNTPVAIGSSDTINVVAVGVRYNAAVAAAEAAFQVRIKKTSGGTVSSSSAITPNSTSWNTNANAIPHNYPLTLYQDPDSSNWTKATLDTAQAGYNISTTNTNAADISTLWVLVDSTPAAGTTTSTTTSTTTTSTSTSSSTTTTSTSTTTSTTTTSTSSSTTTTSTSTTITGTTTSTSTTTSTTTTSTSSSSSTTTTSTSTTTSTTTTSTSTTHTTTSTSTSSSTTTTSTSTTTSTTTTSTSSSTTTTSTSTTTSTTTTSTSSSTTTTSTSSSSSTTTTSTSSSSSTTTSTTTISTSTTQSTTTSTSTTTTSTSTSSSTSTTLTLPYEFEVDRPDLQA